MSFVVRTMNDILSFAQEIVARPGYKRVFYKMEDAANAKGLEDQLAHAFRVFEVLQRLVITNAGNSDDPLDRYNATLGCELVKHKSHNVFHLHLSL